ncbi:hypothetical protein AGABI2DRAFT_186076 [Agaricus bisporus var. bisporus H97]|uniref:hypothetical protein n=1 Tax=Agaricus bisporus var. bisporus (strain H97 / ATCC MYA-4626 / FGSC 10389) TaxID=936046 RepID=UPI00029F66B3|nr:hypothetical protein AGABI2DRAFT_186076 [Agaricus bisporus var. bisporus H97]EKV46668.1 hypothetical protein AGABI2DRAFT_186076 [Agaricus bisporus var. bisporus H97]
MAVTGRPRVLIVGAGPSGLTLALSLLQNDIPVRIIEKNSAPRLGQRGAGLMPRSLEVFTTLRIIDQIMHRAIATPRVRKYHVAEDPESFEEYDMHPPQIPNPRVPYLSPMMLGQNHVEHILHSTLAGYGCTVELGTELKSFEQFDDHVQATLQVRGMEQDAQGVEEISSYEYMIGTDGARGIVRKQLGLSFLGETRVIDNFVVGDMKVEGLLPNRWHMWGDPATLMASLRATEEPGLFNFLLAGKNVNHAELAFNQDLLRKVLTEATGNRPDLVFRECPWISSYTPNIRMVNKFRVRRVFVAGDSAHVNSPTGGQGMNTGLQDTLNLGWKLALVLKRLSSPSLLDTFTEERLPVVEEMLKQTTKVLSMTFKEGQEKPWDKNSSLFQFGANYRWSSIVLDERNILQGNQETEEEDEFMNDYEQNDIDSYGGRSCLDGDLHAGDRAPDAPALIDRTPSSLFSTSFTLFRVFGSSYHTVLIFPDLADPLPVLKHLQTYPTGLIHTVIIIRPGRVVSNEATTLADFVLEDRRGHAHDAYIGNRNCGVIIVRPDGFIGAIAENGHSIHKYFLTLFSQLKDS